MINVTVAGFLLSEPPPAGTQDAQLPAPLTARFRYSQEPPLPSDKETKEPTPKLVQEVTNKDFKVLYRQEDLEDLPSTLHCQLSPASVSTSQEETNIPEGMMFEEKTLNLLALLTAHARGASLAILVVPRPPTPALTLVSSGDVIEKKRKMG